MPHHLPVGSSADSTAACSLHVAVRQATTEDVAAVASLLLKAAAWLQSRGMPLWRAAELSVESIAADVAAGSFFVATVQRDIAGTLKFQLEDSLFWPDAVPGEAAYLHRLAVRRRFAGGTVARALLDWSVQRTAKLGRPWLRLDCEASRPRLRAVYERYGFRYYSDRQGGPYWVARYQYPVLPGI